MKTTKLIITVAALCLLCGAANAQEQKTLSLSLTQAQDYAVEHNYTMRNATLDVQKAEATKWKAVSSMLPQINGQFDYSNMCGYELNLGAMSIPMNPSGSLGITAAVALTAGQIMGAVMSDISKQMSDITLEKSDMTTRASVKSVYVSILAMEEIVSLLDSSLANIQRLHRMTEESVRAGAAEQISADKLAVQVASMQNTIRANRRSLTMLYNTLLLQLGADVDSKLQLTTKMDEILNIDRAAQLTMGSFDKTVNYDYQLLEQSERLSKNQVTSAWLGFTPTLSVYYQYSYKTYFGKSEGMNMTPPNMVGASMSLPLFQSGSRMAAIREAKISHQETLNSKQQAEDALAVQYNQLCYDLVSAIESYRLQRSNLEVTQRVFENTANKYRYGRASNLELTNASSDIITAQSNYIQAVMNVISAQVSLEQLLGKQE